MKKEKTIAIIPARGNSKRLKGKNLLYLGDKTLLEHSILYAKLNLDIIDKIYVSTDNEEIKSVAVSQGIDVIDRPGALATDTASTVSVLKNVLELVEEKYDHVILLQPTNPLRPVNLLKKAFTQYIEGNHDSLMTVSPYHHKLGKIMDGKFYPYNYKVGQRSQDLETLYYENGLLYICRSDLINQEKILGENNYPLIVDHPFAGVDIDTKEDLEYAKFLYFSL